MEEDPKNGCLTPTCSCKQVHLHSCIHTPAQTHHILTIMWGKKQDQSRGIKPANGTASFRDNMEKFYLLHLSPQVCGEDEEPCGTLGIGDIKLLNKARTQKARGSRIAAKTTVCNYDLLGENFYLSENATALQAPLHR